MSIGRQIWITCDGEDCLETTGDYDARTALDARAIAKQLGWVLVDSVDLCGLCKVVYGVGEPYRKPLGYLKERTR